uniref:Beta/gamma crystallin 'Greek key' domain-containing protein n=1 Tax=Xiphophorus maculatus TaxID=8083 RepID=M4ATH2_XIPMA
MYFEENGTFTVNMAMGTVTVFEQEHFQGKCPEFMTATWTTSAPSDCHIHHSHLQLGGFERHDCQGQLFILERGEYPNRVANAGSLSYHTERFMSIRPIYCFPQSNRMMIFERENFIRPCRPWAGSCSRSAPCMCRADFVCYEYPGYRGQQYIMEYIRHCGALYRDQQQVELEPKNP